jgi:HEAT repeat protein
MLHKVLGETIDPETMPVKGAGRRPIVRPMEQRAETATLVAQALRDRRDDPEAYSPSLGSLHHRADREVCDVALGLLGSSEAEERILAVRVLRELEAVGDSDRERPFWQRSLPAFLDAMTNERDAEVMSELVAGVGFLARPEALMRLTELTRYPDGGVRYSLAGAIAATITDLSRPEAVAITSLDRLAEDEDPDVRYSAVFELAWWGPDDPTVRRRLSIAAEDTDEQVAAYARGGLGRLDGRSLAECPERALVDE